MLGRTTYGTLELALHLTDSEAYQCKLLYHIDLAATEQEPRFKSHSYSAAMAKKNPFRPLLALDRCCLILVAVYPQATVDAN